MYQLYATAHLSLLTRSLIADARMTRWSTEASYVRAKCEK